MLKAARNGPCWIEASGSEAREKRLAEMKTRAGREDAGPGSRAVQG
jgi:hypothetical protein